jgi:hypothetical protein
LLWQHLFWFLAHPEVYVLILPAMGIVAEIIANNTRKPLWGYRAMVCSAVFLGFMSFIVWAHHMFITGMGTAMSAFFQATTMIISIPSVIILTIHLFSKDVIHSFGVYEMRVKQDAIPGMNVPVWFIPTRQGQYEIACSQLCGMGHYRMRGFVTVQSRQAFESWLADEEKALTQ